MSTKRILHYLRSSYDHQLADDRRAVLPRYDEAAEYGADGPAPGVKRICFVPEAAVYNELEVARHCRGVSMATTMKK
jgi:hypothetical protein